MMPTTSDLAQALELAQLVEMEARWENLRKHRVTNKGRTGTDDLIVVQRAYEAFHGSLVAYNRRNSPQHMPELLLNTATRLGRWCADMGELLRKIEADPKARCPVNLIEKAYRGAESMAGRLNQAPPSRRSPPETIQAAIEDLRSVGTWCTALQAPAA